MHLQRRQSVDENGDPLVDAVPRDVNTLGPLACSWLPGVCVQNHATRGGQGPVRGLETLPFT